MMTGGWERQAPYTPPMGQKRKKDKKEKKESKSQLRNYSQRRGDQRRKVGL